MTKQDIRKQLELALILDKYGRDIAVSGMTNHGFSVSTQKILKQLEASLLQWRDAAIAAELRKEQVWR